jgi:hypothetical protein
MFGVNVADISNRRIAGVEPRAIKWSALSYFSREIVSCGWIGSIVTQNCRTLRQHTPW